MKIFGFWINYRILKIGEKKKIIIIGIFCSMIKSILGEFLENLNNLIGCEI